MSRTAQQRATASWSTLGGGGGLEGQKKVCVGRGLSPLRGGVVMTGQSKEASL